MTAKAVRAGMVRRERIEAARRERIEVARETMLVLGR